MFNFTKKPVTTTPTDNLVWKGDMLLDAEEYKLFTTTKQQILDDAKNLLDRGQLSAKDYLDLRVKLELN